MKPIKYSQHPAVWRHQNWNRLQLRYFGEECKSRREKNIEDWIINNGVCSVHLIKDNDILDQFLNNYQIAQVPVDQADLIIITDQRFSRLDTSVMIDKLKKLLTECPRIYFALNKYYLNANEAEIYSNLPENFDHAVVTWLSQQLPDAVILNRSEIFVEDGSCFTWVVPSCEILICKK